MTDNDIEKPHEDKPEDAFAAYTDMFPVEDFIELGEKLTFELMDELREVQADRYNLQAGRTEPYYVRNRSLGRTKTKYISESGEEIESPLDMESLALLFEILGSEQFDLEPTAENVDYLISELKNSENIERAEIDAATTNGFQIAIEGMYVNTDISGRLELIDREIGLVYKTLEDNIKKFCETNKMIYEVEDQGRTDDEDNFKLAAWLFTFTKISAVES
jgi:hypothetical protein